ncbi:MAG TPA: hypothetical protein VGS57_22855 [Thermoanaerobaculia bacterium]|nr:hypothetical protein [Thermoanaerobaculia bacterium]
MNAPERAPTEAVVVPLHSRRLERSETMMAALDGLSGLNLALEARERLSRGGGATVLGWAELAVAAVLLITTVAMLRGRRHFGRWVSGLAGIVLLLDGLSRTYGPKGHPSWALTLNGLVLLTMTGLAPRLEARRRARRVLRLDGEGIIYRRNRLRRFTVPRANIASLVIDGPTALVRTRNGGERRIDLGDLHNRDEAEAALRAWAAAAAVPVSDFRFSPPASNT